MNGFDLNLSLSLSLSLFLFFSLPLPLPPSLPVDAILSVIGKAVNGLMRPDGELKDTDVDQQTGRSTPDGIETTLLEIEKEITR